MSSLFDAICAETFCLSSGLANEIRRHGSLIRKKLSQIQTIEENVPNFMRARIEPAVCLQLFELQYGLRLHTHAAPLAFYCSNNFKYKTFEHFAKFHTCHYQQYILGSCHEACGVPQFGFARYRRLRSPLPYHTNQNRAGHLSALRS